MLNQAQPPTSRVPLLGGLGFLAVTAYAVLGTLQVLVFNPLAAMPGMTLAQIQHAMEKEDESLAAPLVFSWAILGIALALGALVLSVRQKFSRYGTATAFLLLVSFGAPSLWIASFPAGMSLADTFGISGGDHAPWASVLNTVSAAALLVIVLLRFRNLASKHQEAVNR